MSHPVERRGVPRCDGPPMTPSPPVSRSALAHPRWVARTIALIAFGALAALCVHALGRPATARTSQRDAQAGTRTNATK
jgi:hypothetical protein